MKPLSGYVCLVTGASRGIGKGIALQLGEAGATVYVTGRTLKNADNTRVAGSLQETAEEIGARGGKVIPVCCDHSNDEQVSQLFDQINLEQKGRLDVLVNSAYSAVTAIMENLGKKFYEIDVGMWDTVNNVGLRGNYVCSWHASRMMVESNKATSASGDSAKRPLGGLIVNISSLGGLRYLFNVPYGVGKAGVDRMAADMAVELRKQNVAVISVCPGMVSTEEILLASTVNTKTQAMFKDAESPEFSGKTIVALIQDPKRMQKSGRTVLCSDLADEYGGIVDTDGRKILSARSVQFAFKYVGWPRLARLFPSWIKVPRWVICLIGNKY